MEEVSYEKPWDMELDIRQNQEATLDFLKIIDSHLYSEYLKLRFHFINNAYTFNEVLHFFQICYF